MPPESPSDGPSEDPSLEVQGNRRLQVVITVGVVLALAAVAIAGVALVGRDDGTTDRGGEDASSTAPAAPGSASSLDLPTIDASDFPSDLPTSPPTVVPSGTLPPPDRPGEVRSEAPPGIPSDMPPFPTDPADLESWFSDYLEQVSPR